MKDKNIVKHLLRYKFLGLDFIGPLTKYPHELTHYLKPT